MEPSIPVLGSTLDQIDTPCLLIDLNAFESNVKKMAAYCAENGVAWRPHSKCHKSPDIARAIVEAGGIGVTCAKLGEAEVMAAAGVKDLLIANPLVGPIKLRRLAALREIADPITIVDHPDQVDALAAALPSDRPVRTLIEIDIGMSRCGVQPGEAALPLARRIHESASLELAGIMGYEGHLLRIEDPVEKEGAIAASIGLLNDTKEAFLQAELPCPIVSAGGTGSYQFTARQPGSPRFKPAAASSWT